LIGAEEFLKDLLNDQSILSSFTPFRGNSEASGLKFTQLNCNVLNMAYFEVFNKLGLVTDKGDIRQDFEERYEGLILQDRIRKAWLWEENEDMEAYDTLHTEKY
jgi:hypothetical protein